MIPGRVQQQVNPSESPWKESRPPLTQRVQIIDESGNTIQLTGDHIYTARVRDRGAQASISM